MSNGNPTVTVYIISHNFGRFVYDAVASVLNQDTDDYEVLVIDDGSTDNTPAVLAAFANDLCILPHRL